MFTLLFIISFAFLASAIEHKQTETIDQVQTTQQGDVKTQEKIQDTFKDTTQTQDTKATEGSSSILFKIVTTVIGVLAVLYFVRLLL